MATIGDLPSVLLYQIIFMVVQSSLSAVDFARIISVCRDFFAFADDDHLLRVVSFDDKMDCKNYCNYQHVNGLVVKCSRVGNVTAQFLLGKVIVFSSWTLDSERPTWDLYAGLYRSARLGQILTTNVNDRRIKDLYFVKNFLPTEASTSDSSQARLVHYQLVRVFLQYISYRDVVATRAYLGRYIAHFSQHNGRNYPFVNAFECLLLFASDIRDLGKMIKMRPERDAFVRVLRYALDAKSMQYIEARDELLQEFDANFA